MNLTDFLNGNRSIIAKNKKLISFICKKYYDIKYIRPEDSQYIGINHMIGGLINIECHVTERVEVSRMPNVTLLELESWLLKNIPKFGQYMRNPLMFLFRDPDFQEAYPVKHAQTKTHMIDVDEFCKCRPGMRHMSIDADEWSALYSMITSEYANNLLPLTWSYLRTYTTNMRRVTISDVDEFERRFEEVDSRVFDVLRVAVASDLSNGFTSLLNQLFALSEIMGEENPDTFTFLIPNINAIWSQAQNLQGPHYITNELMVLILDGIGKMFNVDLISISKYYRLFNIDIREMPVGTDILHLHFKGPSL